MAPLNVGRKIAMPITVEDLFQDAALGVIRALDARRAGQQNLTDVTDASTAGLIRSGFFVEIHIRTGGMPPAAFEQPRAFLNPQPLPPTGE
jgi:hypothetical protein